jgi:uncharacterized membrane protein
VLFLPGYALSVAIFGRQSLGGFERLVLSVALSIAVSILTGTVLNFTRLGLQPTTWLIALVSITLCAAVYALLKSGLPMTTPHRWKGPLRPSCNA